MLNVLLVALGGALGAVSRFAVGAAFARRWGVAWPYGTFFINITGCFIIGLFLPILADRPGVNEAWKYLLPVGFVGAYTTFSTYEYETLRLVESAQYLRAGSYVLFSNVIGFAAVWIGVLLGRKV
jgi:CrcB protein